MPEYRYQAKDAEARFVEGSWEADSLQVAREQLQQRGLALLVLEESVQAVASPEPKGWDLGVTPKGLARFTRQLAAMLGSGIPLLRALDSVSRRSAGPTLRRAVIQVARQVQEGGRFSDALASQPQVFDGLYVAMMRVGEITGDLAISADRLATLLERDVAARRRVGLAMAYPLIVLAVAVVLTWGMATFMMPIFEPMFREGGLDLERDFPVTALLMKLGHLGSSPIFLGGVALVALVSWWGLVALGRAQAGQHALDRVKLNVPIVSQLLRMSLTARFARGLAALTRGGVPMAQALVQAGEATGNRVFARAATEMGRGIGEGRRVSRLLSEQPLFDPILLDMVDVGEQSGNLAEMLESSANYFEDEANNARELMTTALEPLMMLVVGAIVSIFVVALMVPLMSLGQH